MGLDGSPQDSHQSTTTSPVYLDYNATTPICKEAREAMAHYLMNGWPHGNPSSGHVFGQDAKAEVDRARQRIASAIGCDPTNLIFTSGGTESNNHAIIGAALHYREKDPKRNHIVTSSIEHPSVMEVCKHLESSQGFKVTYVAVNTCGIIDMEELSSVVSDCTAVVTVMHANNETGSVQPIADIARIAKEAGAIVHSDAAQSVGKIPVNVDAMGVDLLAVCSHKFYGPKGIGALYIRPGLTLNKMMHGAGHERGLRAGTENVLEMIGLGIAIELATSRLEESSYHMKTLRDRIHELLRKGLGEDGVHLNGHPDCRLPNTLNVSLKAPGASSYASAPQVLEAMGEVAAASAGSACHSGSVSLSPVLVAMNIDPEIAQGALRLSTGMYLTMGQAEFVAQHLIEAAKRLSG